ncbi:MAG: MgtC/SapB family protein [Silvibacterium sp.]
MQDWFQQLHGNRPSFPLTEIALKAAVAIATGMLVGIEREWSQKDIGVRTFALTALLGLLSSLTSQPLMLASAGAVLLVVAFLNFRKAQTAGKLEATTSIALMLVFVMGVLVGNGHLFTPVACAILVTMLLSLKPQLRAFAGDLQPQEIRSALLLGLFGFVIWPLLPNRYIDRWSLIDPRQAWIIVIVVACLGFVNYVLLRIYGSKGVYTTALLGGLVNSTATVAELSTRLPAAGLEDKLAPAVLITSAAMFLRNLVILALFAHAAAEKAWFPLLVMAAVSALWVIQPIRAERKAAATAEASGEVEKRTPLMDLGSPVSIEKVLKFAGLFLAIQIAGTLAQRFLGSSGLQIVSVIGGLVSSASTTAAAADLAFHGKAAAMQVAIAVVLTSIASAVIDLPIVRREDKTRRAFPGLVVATVLQIAAGAAALLLESHLEKFF